MKACFLFTVNGPVVILISYDSIEDPGLSRNLSCRSISKFITCGVSVELARNKFGKHFEVVCRFLQDKDDLRVLYNSGQRFFSKFGFNEPGNPVYHNSD